MLKSILALSFCLLSGCASMFQGPTQNITVVTVNDKNIDKTRCNIKNEEGAWIAAPNSAVSIHRDGNSMEIKCDNDLQTGINHVDPSFSGGYLALDLLLDICIVSCIVDGVNNSFYDYPQSATVMMNDK